MFLLAKFILFDFYTNMNVTFNTYPKNSYSFTGITRQMNKHIYIDGQKDIKEIIEEHDDRSLQVGQLPKFLRDKLDKENYKETIKEFYDTFAQVTEELRAFDETKPHTIDEIMKRRDNSTKELLKNLFLKHNIIQKWDAEDFDIKYLGKGGKGAGYKIEGVHSPDFDEDEFVLKVYHTLEGKSWQPYKSHGCYAEINSAAYWMENVGYNSQRGKFFCGDLKSGYMLIKYVDDDVRLPKKMIDPYNYGLKCTDEDIAHKHNVCKNYSFDWGGVRIINRIKNESKTARSVANYIKKTPNKYRSQEWGRLFYNDKNYDKSQKNAGLAMAIKHLPNKKPYIDTCIKLNDFYVDRGLAYVLKYLKYEDAIKYFEKLVQTDDIITQVILFNEIPLLAMKHRDVEIKDDLQTERSQIIPERIKEYYDISEKYALPQAIEHLASFIHLLPEENFKPYYEYLSSIDNYDLKDRLIYKLSNVKLEDKGFCCKNIAQNLYSPDLTERLLAAADVLTKEDFDEVKKLLNENIS